MKMYLVKRINRDKIKYDQVAGFVILASSPRSARKKAAEQCSDEGFRIWLNKKEVSVKELPGKEKGVILRDYRAG